MKKKIIIKTAFDLMKSPNLAKIKKPRGTRGIREVIFTRHAKQRLVERFQVNDLIQMKEISEKAILEGQLFIQGHHGVIKHHSLLLVGWVSNETFTITTAINRNNGISRNLKNRIHTKPISLKPFKTDLKVTEIGEDTTQRDKLTKHQVYLGGTESDRFENLPIENTKEKALISSAGG